MRKKEGENIVSEPHLDVKPKYKPTFIPSGTKLAQVFLFLHDPKNSPQKEWAKTNALKPQGKSKAWCTTGRTMNLCCLGRWVWVGVG